MDAQDLEIEETGLVRVSLDFRYAVQYELVSVRTRNSHRHDPVVWLERRPVAASSMYGMSHNALLRVSNVPDFDCTIASGCKLLHGGILTLRWKYIWIRQCKCRF